MWFNTHDEMQYEKESCSRGGLWVLTLYAAKVLCSTSFFEENNF